MAANSGNQKLVSSLCKHFSLDPKEFVDDDFKGLYPKILKSALKESPKNNDEVMKWAAFAESYPADSKACLAILNDLNAELVTKSVILGDGLTPSEADIFVFASIHSSVVKLSDSEKEKLPHVMRWIDYIQNKEGLIDIFGKVLVEKADFGPPAFEPQKAKVAAKQEVETVAKNATQNTKSVGKSEADPNTKKTNAGKKAVGDKEPAQDKKKSSAAAPADKDKKKTPAAEPADKDNELSVSLLNIQVGLIRKAWKHPSADSLLVEEIDVGEAKSRQVVSGLAKYCTPEQLTNRLVVLITNVKPGKLRDVVSEGLVLCASSEDHSVVEPLLPPEGAKPGERVSFSGIDGKPEDVLNPKKKQLDKITPHLFTDDKGVATFKGIPFMTSAGPCTSSIPKGTIK